MTREEILEREYEFNWEQMDQIRLGLCQGVDVSIYTEPDFDCDQMFEIRLGLKFGLDVSIYAKPEFDAKQMRQIRREMFRCYLS